MSAGGLPRSSLVYSKQDKTWQGGSEEENKDRMKTGSGNEEGNAASISINSMKSKGAGANERVEVDERTAVSSSPFNMKPETAMGSV